MTVVVPPVVNKLSVETVVKGCISQRKKETANAVATAVREKASEQVRLRARSGVDCSQVCI